MPQRDLPRWSPTGVLKPQTAVAMAATFNFVAIFVFHQLTVAATGGKGTIDPAVIDQYVIFGALMGAIFWNLFTGTTAFHRRPRTP